MSIRVKEKGVICIPCTPISRGREREGGGGRMGNTVECKADLQYLTIPTYIAISIVGHSEALGCSIPRKIVNFYI